MKVVLIPTAGALKEIYDRISGERLPFWLHWPLLKQQINQWGKDGIVTVRHIERLKPETIVRLEKALEVFRSSSADMIFCVGGYSPRRERMGIKDSVQMMNDWLLDHGVPEHSVNTGKVFSVDTGTNAREFFVRFERAAGLPRSLTIYLVTSWYHLFRAKVELKKVLKDGGIPARIVPVPAWPSLLDRETLEYECLWNIPTEFFMKIPGLLSWALKMKMREFEYHARQ